MLPESKTLGMKVLEEKHGTKGDLEGDLNEIERSHQKD